MKIKISDLEQMGGALNKLSRLNCFGIKKSYALAKSLKDINTVIKILIEKKNDLLMKYGHAKPEPNNPNRYSVHPKYLVVYNEEINKLSEDEIDIYGILFNPDDIALVMENDKSFASNDLSVIFPLLDDALFTDEKLTALDIEIKEKEKAIKIETEKLKKKKADIEIEKLDNEIEKMGTLHKKKK